MIGPSFSLVLSSPIWHLVHATEIVPFALADSGLRWHLRAFDRRSGEFRDGRRSAPAAQLGRHHGENGAVPADKPQRLERLEAQVRRQYHALKAALPGVDLHYALKPLPHAAVVQCLKREGAFFDLATTGEVELVKAQGIAPERCIHTHPIKRESDIRDALRFGVTT